MKRSTATRLAEDLEAMAGLRSHWLRFSMRHVSFTTADARDERETLLKASVELRRLAAKKGKKKQSKVEA